MSDEPVVGPEVSAEDGPSGVEAGAERLRAALRALTWRANEDFEVVALAAVVDALGITPEMVEAPTEHHARARIDALSVLLHAAGRTEVAE